MFSFGLPVIRNDQGRNRKSQQINTCLSLVEFWVFDHGLFYRKSGLLVTGRVHLSQREGEDLCTGVSRTH